MNRAKLIKLNILIVIMTTTVLGPMLILHDIRAIKHSGSIKNNLTINPRGSQKLIYHVKFSASQPQCKLTECKISCTGGAVEQLASTINALFDKDDTKCLSSIYALILTNTVFTNKTIQSGWLKAAKITIKSIKIASTTIESFGSSIFVEAPFDSSTSLSVQFSNIDLRILNTQMFMGSSIGSFEVDFDSMYDGMILEENIFGYKPSAVYSITLKNCLKDTAVLKNLTGKGVLLSGLTRLDLSYNLLLTLDSGIFSKTPKLQQLYLISSGINTIELGTFDGLSNLIMLYLTNNNLKTLPNGLFNDLTAILSFFIDGNPWICECNMQWFKDFLGKLPPLDYKRCRDGSGWVNMDDVEFCPDNSTPVIDTSSTGKSTSTEAIQTSTIPVPTNDFIFEKIICRNLLMYNDEINHSTLWLESTFKRRNIKYLFSEITNPSIFILNLDAKLTSNDFFIWTNVQNRSDYGCVFNISSIITMNLRYDETYTLCFSSNDTTDTYAFIADDCTAVTTPPDWSHRPWLLNSQKIIVIVIALLTTLASIVISSVIVYFLIKYNPELLKGNKRVLIVKRGSYSPNVLIMPNEKKLRHISLCTDNEGYLAPKLKPHWKTPAKKYMDFDNFSDGSVFLDNEDKGLEREIYEPPPVPPNHPMKRRDSVKPYFYSNM